MVAAEQGPGHMVLSAAEFAVTEAAIPGVGVVSPIADAFDLLMRFRGTRPAPRKTRA